MCCPVFALFLLYVFMDLLCVSLEGGGWEMWHDRHPANKQETPYFVMHGKPRWKTKLTEDIHKLYRCAQPYFKIEYATVYHCGCPNVVAALPNSDRAPQGGSIGALQGISENTAKKQ